MGLALAKYAQAWAASPVHPGALLGVVMVLVSLTLAFIATRRYLDRGLAPDRAPAFSRALASLALLLVNLFACGALVIILFAGWEFPPGAAGAAAIGAAASVRRRYHG